MRVAVPVLMGATGSGNGVVEVMTVVVLVV